MPGIADLFGRASIANNYAVATTVKTTRTAGVTVLEAIDLSKYSTDTPVYFVTYKKTTDPVTNITSVTNLVSYKALVNTGANTLTNLTVAPGYTDLGNAVGDFIECIPTSYWESQLIDGIFVGHNPDGTFKLSALKAALGNDGNLVQSLDDTFTDFVLSGGLWTFTLLNGSMSALVGYINGYKNTLAAVVNRAFTVNKDTYVDVLYNTTTNVFSLVYTEVAVGATSGFTLAANSMRIAKVTTNGTTITAIDQANPDFFNNPVYPQNLTGKKLTHLRYESVGVGSWPNNGTIPYATKIYDLKNDWNASTYRFTVTEPGLYRVEGRAWWGSAGASNVEVCELFLRKNGSNYTVSDRMNGSGDANRLMRPYASTSIYLNIGDYIDFALGSSNLARDLVGGSNTYVEINRIG